VSTLVAGLGMLMLSRIDPRSTALDLIIPLCVLAFGLGFGMAQRTNLVAVAVPKDDIGEASAILALVRNISGAFGVAIFSTILDSKINANVIKTAQHSIVNSASPQALQQFVGLIELKAQVAGYASVFEIAASMILIGAFAAFLITVPKEAITHEHHVIAE
jgi:hypothetical protein